MENLYKCIFAIKFTQSELDTLISFLQRLHTVSPNGYKQNWVG